MDLPHVTSHRVTTGTEVVVVDVDVVVGVVVENENVDYGKVVFVDENFVAVVVVEKIFLLV